MGEEWLLGARRNRGAIPENGRMRFASITDNDDLVGHPCSERSNLIVGISYLHLLPPHIRGSVVTNRSAIALDARDQ